MSRRSSLRVVAVFCLCLATLTACGGGTLEPEPGPLESTLSPGRDNVGVDPPGPPDGGGGPPSTGPPRPDPSPGPGGNVGVDPPGPPAPTETAPTTPTTESPGSTAGGG
jgi:hypothetical protein